MNEKDVDLAVHGEKLAGNFSGGMRRRLSVAIGMCIMRCGFQAARFFRGLARAFVHEFCLPVCVRFTHALLFGMCVFD